MGVAGGMAPGAGMGAGAGAAAGGAAAGGMGGMDMGGMASMLGGFAGGGAKKDPFAQYLVRLSMTDPQTAALFQSFLGGGGGGGSPGMDPEMLKKLMAGKTPASVSDSSAAGLSGEGALFGSNLGGMGGAMGGGVGMG